MPDSAGLGSHGRIEVFEKGPEICCYTRMEDDEGEPVYPGERRGQDPQQREIGKRNPSRERIWEERIPGPWET